MFTKQLSVFIENRNGRLEDVAGALEEESVNIMSLSLADTSEYGILRLVVNEPERALTALRGRGFSATLTDILAVSFPNRPGAFHALLKTMAVSGLNVEYMYIIDCGAEDVAMAVKVSDANKARELIESGVITAAAL